MPRPRVTMAIAKKPGLRRSWRSTNRKSFIDLQFSGFVAAQAATRATVVRDKKSRGRILFMRKLAFALLMVSAAYGQRGPARGGAAPVPAPPRNGPPAVD